MRYFTNLGKFLSGFLLLHTIHYKPGWNAWKFAPLYLVDYGTHTLTGGAVVSWSRWAWQNRQRSRIAATINRLLEHFDSNHGAEAGPALWGTTDCRLPVRLIATAFWIVVVAW